MRLATDGGMSYVKHEAESAIGRLVPDDRAATASAGCSMRKA